VLDNIAVGNYIFEGVVIHGAYKFDAFRVVSKGTVAVVNGTDDSCSKTLSVFLRFHEESASNEFLWIDDLQLSLWDCTILSSIFNRFDDERCVNLPITQVSAEIGSRGIESGSNFGTVEDLAGMIGKYFVRHTVTYGLGKADEATADLAGFGGKCRLFGVEKDRFIPGESKHDTAVRSRASEPSHGVLKTKGCGSSEIQNETNV
jgi:hypothetical protein